MLRRKFGQVYECPACKVERGFGQCDSCKKTAELRQHQEQMRLFKDPTGRMQVVTEDEAPAGTPIVTLIRKPRRNEPCPCRSGRKYKKCCGAEAAEARNLERDFVRKVVGDAVAQREAEKAEGEPPPAEVVVVDEKPSVIEDLMGEREGEKIDLGEKIDPDQPGVTPEA